jgi:hypothetical protein
LDKYKESYESHNQKLTVCQSSEFNDLSVVRINFLSVCNSKLCEFLVVVVYFESFPKIRRTQILKLRPECYEGRHEGDFDKSEQGD